MPKAVIASSRLLRAALLAALLAMSGCAPETPQSLIASGNAHFERKDFNAAILQYKNALQRDPGLMEARRRLGEALLIVGDLKGALLELSKAVKDKGEFPTVLPILSRALVLEGEYRKLVSDYGDVTLDDKAGQAELKTNVAIAWGGLHDVAKVTPAIDAALRAVPGYGPALVVKARYLAAKGQFDEAIALLDGVVARNPKLHEAWLVRGHILERAKNDSAGAEVSYRRAVEADPTYAPAHAAIVMVRVRQADIAGAKAQAEKLRAVLPKHPYTMLLNAQIAFADRKPEQAREILQVLLQAFPDSPSILLLSGAVQAQLGAATQAAAHLGKALRLDPTLDAARRTLAEIEIRQGQYSQALVTLKPLLDAPQAAAGTYALAADAEIRLRRPAAAEKYYNLAAKADPTNTRFQAAAAMTRMARGDAAAALTELQSISEKSEDTYADEILFAVHMRRRDYDAALATLDAMVRKAPGRAALLDLRGQVHLARRDHAAARMAFEQAVKADPALFAAIGSLARLDVVEGKAERAVARLSDVVKLNPGNAAAWLLLAELKARYAKGSVAEIRAAYAEAIKAAPTEAAPRLQLIDYTLRTNRFKDALAAAQSAAGVLPGDVRILDALGQAQMHAGDNEQAAATFRQLAAAVPTSPEPYMRLGALYAAAGKYEQAESALNLAIEVNPAFAPAQAALVDLLIRARREKDALNYVRRVRGSKPNQPLGYSLEATYHSRRKDLDAAAAVLREGTARTGNSELAVRLFATLTQAKRVTEADSFGAAWIKAHPNDSAFEYLLAETDLARKNYKSAEARLRRVLAAQGDNVVALNNLAWVLATTGGSGALGYAQRALDIAPDEPGLLDTLALALAADKQTAAALDVQKRAVEISPEDNRLRLGLARIALQAGDKDLARKELKRLDELGPTYSEQAEVKKLLQTL